MRVPIQPITILVPGKGNVTLDTIDIETYNHQLNVGAEMRWLLLKTVVTPATETEPEKTEMVHFGHGGIVALTPEQFAAWGTDDSFVAACVLQNLMLQPA